MVELTADQHVDLCLGDMVQDLVEDNVTAAQVRPDMCLLPNVVLLSQNSAVVQAAAVWAESDSSTALPAQRQGQQIEQEADHPAASSTDASVLIQQPSIKTAHTSEGLPEEPEELEEPESAPVKQEGSHQEEQENFLETSVEDYPEAAVSEGVAESMPGPSDKTAAGLSKALRKLQAESAVLQEHSRRLQEKATVIQQQRASADQVHKQ